MSTAELPEAILVEEVDTARIEAAAKLLEQAARSGLAVPVEPAGRHGSLDNGRVHYLLAMAYKRLGKLPDARAALRKITPPDASVWLQMGLLSLREGNAAQAEQEFARAWEADPACHEAGYNLLLTRLTLDQYPACAAMLPRLRELAPSLREQHQLSVLGRLIHALGADRDGGAEQHSHKPGEDGFSGQMGPEGGLSDLSAEDEQRMIRLIRSLGKMDTAITMLGTLLKGRAGSVPLQEAYVEACLVKAKDLLDRSQWGEAQRLLEPLRSRTSIGRATQAVLMNLLGCCFCLNQDFETGLRHFSAAARLSGNDPRIHQNIALTHEFLAQHSEAEPHWNRFFDLLDRRVSGPPGVPDYSEQLAFEGLTRLATAHTEKEKWQIALGYVKRAHELRPGDLDTLERMFHLAAQLKKKDEARRTLRRLRELKPGEPQYELFELDLIDVNNLNDVEKLLGEIDRILKRHPNEPRVEARAAQTVGNVIPLIGNICDQLTDQLRRVGDQVRHLPNHQVNWSAVHDVMRELLREFQKLRRITGKCLPLVTNEDQRRVIRELGQHIDEKIDFCRSMSG